MKKLLLIYTLAAITLFGMQGCGGNIEEPSVPEQPVTPEVPEQTLLKRTILVYAVASNNLQSDLQNDKSEMLGAMSKIDASKFCLMVYQVTRNGEVDLLEAKDNGLGSMEFESVKTYDNQTLSTDPARMAEVFADVKALRPSESYGLVMWAHGSSWEPGGTPHPDNSSVPPVFFAYGGDETTGTRDWTDVDELARALPQGMFDFIWFDNCFMSSIEVAYQFRDKVKYMVAYPTEIYSPGMPYDNTIPYMLRETPDLISAAKSTFNYYAIRKMAASVCVMDMSKINRVAEVCRSAHENFSPVSTTGLQDYSRYSYGPYYDFGQYIKRLGENSATFSVSDFDAAMEDFVLFKNCSSYDFNGSPLDVSVYSGLSTYAFGTKSFDSRLEYYKKLDWYKDVVKQ